MDAKEIKSSLKAARELIRSKDYNDAAERCKAVLEADPNNYNALVFLGVATEALEQVDQALKAYRKASELQPDMLLAWQGMSGMLEKRQDLMTPAESIEVFNKLISLHGSDVSKQAPQYHKLMSLFMKTDQKDKARETIDWLLEVEKDEEKRLKPLCNFISLHSQQAPKIPENDLIKYEAALHEVVKASDEPEPDRDTYARLLLHLVSQINVDQLMPVCQSLGNAFPELHSPLEFKLRSVLDRHIGVGYPSQSVVDSVTEMSSALNLLQEQNPVAKVGQAFIEIHNKNYSSARDHLTDIPDDLICGQYYFSQVQLYLHSSQSCIEACQKGLSAISKPDRILCALYSHVKALFELASVEAYIETGTKDAQDKAQGILEEVQEKMPTEAFLMKSYLYLDQGKIAEAETCVGYLPCEALPVQTLKASIHLARKDFEKALNILQNVVKQDATDARAILFLGIALWELRHTDCVNDVKQECFKTLLKAAKLDPHNYKCFLHIGIFYKEIQKDTLKAKRCFQKAFDLRPESEESGRAFVDALIDLGEENQALEILKRVTSASPAGRGKWAWLRLGLHQMRHEDSSTAIMSLQSALRADPQDHHVWECLSEAYLQRGSFTAALKSFTKASELNPESVYCLHQIASIKHTLGLTAEAIEEFKTLLHKSPTYVPALKGISESLLQSARQHLSQCLDGLAKDNLEESIMYLTRAASQRPDISCLWKLMGEACSLASHLSVDAFSVPAKLVTKEEQAEGKEAFSSVTKMELLQIGSRCFSQALKSLPNSGSLWHDLGINLFYQSELCKQTAGEEEKAVTLLEKTLQVMKKSVSLEPKDSGHWNALGVIACSKINHQPALAQHCFIKSIELESSNAVAWTNLGSMYLDKGDVKLAHEAFKAAQSIDPTYMACWIGQALIAEIVGHEEAMDLFRHTTELGFHVESAVSYGQWVLSVLTDSSKRDSDLYQYCIKQMAALPAASDALARYTTRVTNDALAYNMQGLLFEHQKLFLSAAEAFTRALEVLEKTSDQQATSNTVKLNLARILCKQKKYSESVSLYEKCDVDHVEHLCLYGLALFHCGSYETSSHVFQQALPFAQDTPLLSQIYASLGAVAFMHGDLSAAKSFLFDGFQTSDPSLGGLLALCSLGILQSDTTLASAVLDELFKRKDVVNSSKVDAVFLEFNKCLIEASVQDGESKIREYIASDPSNAALWSLLASLMLRTNNISGDVVTECSRTAFSHETRMSARTTCTMLQSLGQLSAGDHSRVHTEKNALRNALKAFHANPGCVKTTATLACAVHAEAEITRSSEGYSELLRVKDTLLNIILEDNESTSLKVWSLQQQAINNILRREDENARTILAELQNNFSGSAGVQDFVRDIQNILSGQSSNSAVDSQRENSLYKLSLLANYNLHNKTSGVEKGLSLLQSYLDRDDNSAESAQALLERIAYVAYKDIKVSENSTLKGVYENAVKLLKDRGAKTPIVSLLQAMQALRTTPDNKRLIKHLFATALDQVDETKELGHTSSFLRQQLIDLLWDSKKETDQAMVKGLLEDAQSKGDGSTQEYHKMLSSGRN